MIDYTKILLLNIDMVRLNDLPCLDFKRNVSEKTGLLENKKSALYNHCKVTVFDSGIVLFTGSIHKLWNSLNNVKAPNYNNQKNYKGYNGNQFGLDGILEIRNHLCMLFDCLPNQMKFQNIEFGINTTPGFCPQLFILGLLFHYGKPIEFKYNRCYAEVVHLRYRLKIYNKSQQYGICEHTLRIELSHKKSKDFSKTGIKTFEDISKITLNKALELILKRFDKLVYYDNTINKKELNKTAIRKLNKYSNPNYWLNDLTPNKRDKHRKQLQRIIASNSRNLYALVISNMKEKGVIINSSFKTGKRVIFNTSNIELNFNQNHYRKCPVTGINLKYEKENAKYIRTSTITHLKINEPSVYLELCSMLLPYKNGSPRYERHIISHLCKQVRNRFYNSNPIKRTGYKVKQYQNQLQLTL